MMIVEMPLEVFSVAELHTRITLVGLPVSAAFPPSVPAGRIFTKSIVETMKLAKVAADQILEGMSHLMSHGLTTSRADRPWVHIQQTYFRVHAGAFRFPVRLIEYIDLDLILVCCGSSRLHKSQNLRIFIPYLLSIGQHRGRIKLVGGSLGRVVSESGFPEHDKMFRLLAVLETPAAGAVSVVNGGVGTWTV